MFKLPKSNNLKIQKKGLEVAKEVKQETRREGLAVDAICPDTGKTITLYLAHSRLIWFEKSKNAVPIYQAHHLVPKITIKPKPLYTGLLNEKDDSQKGLTRNERGVGWICYAGIPDKDYDESGQEIDVCPGEVFLVFANDKQIIYNWRWEHEDPDNPGCPFEEDGEGRRFKEKIF